VDTSAGINVAEAHVQFSESVKLLGIQLDNALSMDSHVSAVVRGCNYHIRAMRHSRPRLHLNTAKMIAQGIVAARLDYCNSLIPAGICVACRSPRTHLPGQCIARRGLPAPLSCVARCTGCQSDNYLLQDVADSVPGSSNWLSGVHHVTAARLRSTTAPSTHGQIAITITFLSFTLGNGVFCVSAPQVWNTLSPLLHCRASPSTDSFKRRLKAELFNTSRLVSSPAPLIRLQFMALYKFV